MAARALTPVYHGLNPYHVTTRFNGNARITLTAAGQPGRAAASPTTSTRKPTSQADARIPSIRRYVRQVRGAWLLVERGSKTLSFPPPVPSGRVSSCQSARDNQPSFIETI